MNICLRHGQAYPLDSHCPYCGPAPTNATTGRTDEVVLWDGDLTLAKCRACEDPDTSAGHTCGLWHSYSRTGAKW